MLNSLSEQNTEKNKQHYDKLYANVNISRILKIVANVEDFLKDVATVDTSWVCMYYNLLSRTP